MEAGHLSRIFSSVVSRRCDYCGPRRLHIHEADTAGESHSCSSHRVLVLVATCFMDNLRIDLASFLLKYAENIAFDPS